MADHDPSTQPPAEPSGSAEARLAALQRLENGEATKQSQMKWVDGANYGMLGADVGYGVYAAGSAAMGAGATGAAAAGAAAVARCRPSWRWAGRGCSARWASRASSRRASSGSATSWA